MRTKTSPQRIAFGLLTILMPVVFFAAGAHSVTAQTCPLPFAKVAGQCVLTADAPPLKHTLTLAPNTILNCQSHHLVALHQGKNLTTRSTPEVAIFLNAAENVQIKNCVILGFDFGIFAINSKHPPGSAPIQILQNKVRARFVAISLMSVDDAEIKGNLLEWRTKGGRGLYVGRDSDRNKILDNHLSAHLSNTSKAVRAPGPVSDIPGGLGSNSVVTDGSAVLITQTEGPEPTLLNAIIENSSFALCPAPALKCLFQLPVEPVASPSPSTTKFSEDNTFERNTIRLFGTQRVDGVALSIAQGTTVSQNTVKGAKAAIRIGIQSGPPPDGFKKQFSGKCAAKSSRFCLNNGDCNINGIDAPPMSDTCMLPEKQSVFWVSGNSTIENNQINGASDVGIATAGEGTVLTGNTVTRPVSSPLGIGIRLVGPFGLGPTTVVTGNTVKGSAIALNLVRTIPPPPAQPGLEFSASTFEAKISLNDFIVNNTTIAVSTLAVGSPNDYHLLSGDTQLWDLVTLKGNYWGTPCPIGLAPGKVQPMNPKIKDSHPYGVPVARASPEPSPCR